MPFSLDGFGSSMYETINSTILFTPQTTDMCKMVNDQLGLGDSRYHFIWHILPILVQGKIPLQFSASNQSIHHEVFLKGITFEMKLT